MREMKNGDHTVPFSGRRCILLVCDDHSFLTLSIHVVRTDKLKLVSYPPLRHGSCLRWVL